MIRAFALSLLAIAAFGPPAAAATSPTAADVALAKRVSLRVTDLPAGWTTSPQAGAPSGCFSPPVVAQSPTAQRPSGRFQDPSDRISSSSTVAVFATRAGALRALAGITRPAVFDCYRRTLARELPAAGAALESFRGGPIAFDRVGDRALAFRYGVGVQQGTSSGVITFDFVFVVRGRVLISEGFIDETHPLATGDERAVLAKLAGRAAA